MFKGGSRGPALVAGSAEKSLLYQRIANKSMPPVEPKVTEDEARIIRDWIRAGARTAVMEKSLAPGKDEKSHWAFRPPVRPQLPLVKNPKWVSTPIDAFVLSQLETKGIKSPAIADRRTLLRRVYLDLIGLPPTPGEQKAFLNDRSSDAYAKVVDNLLSRPQYGERWARHWLDVVRYAESNGYERDGTKPHAWRYRDYVIDFFNRDRPYDRFLIEQLAGDEIEGSNAKTQIATTFLRLGTWDDEPAEPLMDRYDQLDDVLGTTATAFLGLTLRCARCHDHKFEPFSQKDYYRVLAVFEPLKRPHEERKDLDRFVGTDEELTAYQEATAKADAEVAAVQTQIEALNKELLKRLFAGAEKKRGTADLSWLEHAETVVAYRTEPQNRTKEQEELIEKFNAKLEQELHKQATEEERAELDEWKKQIAAINAARPKEPLRAYIWYEEGSHAPPTHVFERGDPTKPNEEVQVGLPPVLAQAAPEPSEPTKKSTGRRLWLARWLTRRDNPLVARVMVNRIWQWHFGEGLVASENDFGVMGQRPTHPELLDYLAQEFIESGWSIKHLQRLIVNSNTYKASSAWNAEAAKTDPDGVSLWRWQPRRLQGEVVRDSMLAISGRINLEMGGPSVYPPLPRAVLEGQSRPGDGWEKSEERQAARRSIYIFVKRSLAVPELEVLDAPDTTSSCEQRPVSTTGPQALTFLNGDFAQEQARYFAARLLQEAGPATRAQIHRGFELALARPPRGDELKIALDFLASQQRQIEADAQSGKKEAGDARQRALEAFCLVLLNTNEFFYLN
jgi:hypothetical protein